MDDTGLEQALFPPQPARRCPGLRRITAGFIANCGVKGVTLQLLHLEYKQSHPDGYQYTRFYELYADAGPAGMCMVTGRDG